MCATSTAVLVAIRWHPVQEDSFATSTLRPFLPPSSAAHLCLPSLPKPAKVGSVTVCTAAVEFVCLGHCCLLDPGVVQTLDGRGEACMHAAREDATVVARVRLVQGTSAYARAAAGRGRH